MYLFDEVGEFSPKPRLGSSMLRPGVTEVMNARVDRMPSLWPSLVLIDMDEGSFKRPDAPKAPELPKLSPLQRLAMRTYLCVSLALLVSVATFN